jgi:signal transduction histidine kinase
MSPTSVESTSTDTNLSEKSPVDLSDVAAAFAAHCEARIVRQGRLIIGAVGGLNLLWWPLDWVVFAPTLPHHIPALIRIRTILTLITGSFLLFSLVKRWHRWIFHAFFVTACSCCFGAAAAAASVGGPDVPNFHTLYLGVTASLPLPIILMRRTILTASMALSVGLGLFVFTPQHWESKYAGLAVSFLIATFVVTTAFGHSQYALLRSNFFQAAQLGAYGRELESRVAEATAELRRLLTNVETAREAERRHISRELHDELGQELSALRYSLGLTKIRYQSEPQGIAANLNDLENLLRRTAQTTRALVTDLRPRAIDDLGLGAAVDWLVERTEQRSGLTIRLKTSGELMNLSADVAIAAFRILQEALTNILRHAEASEVDIDIDVDETNVTLLVRDDGVGVQAARDKPRLEPSSGVGILGMRERIQALGGEFWMGEEAGRKGTTIRCRMPCHVDATQGEGLGSGR